MGLDIDVRKILAKPRNKNDYFRLIDDNGKYKNDFPEWTKRYERTKTETWFDWEKYKEKTGVDVGKYYVYMESYDGDKGFALLYPENVTLPEYDENTDYDEYQKQLDAVLVRINHKDVPKKKVRIKVLYYDEVGYLRGGMNSTFFKECDNEDAEVYLWTSAELLEYKKKYCSDPDNFQRNIINRFTNGEDVVYINW